ncbi:hypothetical protein Sjap_000737 [Stephania japonica]|uniref:Uncharacterized protein n=1 Tax=Stephania japonica TaxID=461633 RepID=A0AAP0KL10_9MAGN
MLMQSLIEETSMQARPGQHISNHLQPPLHRGDLDASTYGTKTSEETSMQARLGQHINNHLQLPPPPAHLDLGVDCMFSMPSFDIDHGATLRRDDQGFRSMDDDWLHDLGTGRHDQAPH